MPFFESEFFFSWIKFDFKWTSKICNPHFQQKRSLLTVSYFSDLIIPGLVTNGTAKICCHGLSLALFNSSMVIKNGFG